ncbi:MAG: hypothetical protein IPI73_26680 [Betaproteobacteria bacterium]|nr:hypothetical protein [Betaproteobacteria bacterium]
MIPADALRRRAQAAPLESRLAQAKLTPLRVLGERVPQSLFDERAHRDTFARRDLFGFSQQGIGEFDRRLHMGTHTALYCDP